MADSMCWCRHTSTLSAPPSCCLALALPHSLTHIFMILFIPPRHQDPQIEVDVFAREGCEIQPRRSISGSQRGPGFPAVAGFSFLHVKEWAQLAPPFPFPSPPRSANTALETPRLGQRGKRKSQGGREKKNQEMHASSPHASPEADYRVPSLHRVVIGADEKTRVIGCRRQMRAASASLFPRPRKEKKRSKRLKVAEWRKRVEPTIPRAIEVYRPGDQVSRRVLRSRLQGVWRAVCKPGRDR